MPKWLNCQKKFVNVLMPLICLGNTTAATGKGFAIGSAALTAMALISAYMEEIRLWFGKIAKGGEGFVRMGEYVFYNDIAPDCSGRR